MIFEEIDSLYWYKKELFKLDLKHGNYRAIEAETGIKWESAYATIQTAIKEIRTKLKYDTD